jgi:hypothetical protein
MVRQVHGTGSSASVRVPEDRRRAAGVAGAEEPDVLFQKYFKSVGSRTYGVQVKRARNGNHFLVLAESRRDEKSDEPRKTRLLVFSEDFDAFSGMFRDAMEFVRANPVPLEVRRRQDERWRRASQAG